MTAANTVVRMCALTDVSWVVVVAYVGTVKTRSGRPKSSY
jgi:hypothetical protein